MYKYIKKHIKINDYKINTELNIPDIQRIVDKEHINEIYNFENEYYISHDEYCINGCLSIAYDEDKNIEYIIDGQHRYFAYSKLNTMFPHRIMKLSVDYYFFSGGDNSIELIYKLINENKPNLIVRCSIDKYKIIKEIEMFFRKNFNEYIKSTKNPHKPNISWDYINNELLESNIIDILGITNSNDLINKIIELNTYYSTISNEQFKSWGIKNILDLKDKINGKANKFYLGIYSNEWIYRLVDLYQSNKNHHEILHIAKDFRIKINPRLKREVWKTYNEENKIDGNCYCCEEDIHFNEFECGHVIPVTKGGKTHLDNLRPICSQCNKDMGILNLEEFKTQINK